jgi:hypothetical protein
MRPSDQRLPLLPSENTKIVQIIIPDLEWYLDVSRKNNSTPRCPYATVESCPRFYQSLSLLGGAGSTAIDQSEDERLLEKWKNSDLWPKTREQETSISGNNKFFDKFCPEVSYERFGYFASYLGRYSGELDHDLAHKKLGEMRASNKDYRWAWSSVEPKHFTECPLYSVLLHRAKEASKKSLQEKPDEWYKRPLGIFLIGIAITVIGGLILTLLI